MRGPSESLPKYRKHRPSNQAVVTLNGRDFYLGPHGTAVSKREYDRLIGEWLASNRNLPTAPEAITVVEVVAGYLRFAKGHYRKNGKPTETIENIKVVLGLLRDRYGRTPADEFGPKRLKALVLEMISKGWSRRYINDNIGTIKRMFRWAVAEEMVDVLVLQRLQAVGGLEKGRTDARESTPVKPVEDAVVDATLKHLPEVVADMVRLQRLTGMRPAEVCILRPSDVDTSGEVWLYRPAEHKTEHHDCDRVVAIGPVAQGILRPYLLRGATDYCFRPVDSERKRLRENHANRVTPLSCGNRPGKHKRNRRRPPGDRYTSDSYRRAIHRACDAAFPPPTKLKGAELAAWQSPRRWSPNRLRHLAATKIRSQFGLEAAQVALGHTNANITQVYAERDLAKAVEVARKIG